MRAGREFGISEGTIRNGFKKLKMNISEEHKEYKRQKLSNETETALVNHCLRLTKIGYCLSCTQVFDLYLFFALSVIFLNLCFLLFNRMYIIYICTPYTSVVGIS